MAAHVRERLLRGAVERELGLRGRLARRAGDGEASRPGRSAARSSIAGRSSPRRALIAWRASLSPLVARWCARCRLSTTSGSVSAALRQQPCALELQRERGERVGEHVVQLARDAAALGQRRRLRVGGAGLVQLVGGRGEPAHEAHDEEPRREAEQQADDQPDGLVLEREDQHEATDRGQAHERRGLAGPAASPRARRRSRRRRSPRCRAGRPRRAARRPPIEHRPVKRAPGHHSWRRSARTRPGGHQHDRERDQQPVPAAAGLRVGEHRGDEDRGDRRDRDHAHGHGRAVLAGRGQVTEPHAAQRYGSSRPFLHGRGG